MKLASIKNLVLIGAACWTFGSASVSAGYRDRDYGMGDDGSEGAIAGMIVGSGVPSGTPAASDTFDSAFLGLGDGSIVDLRQVRNPVYTSISGRPDGDTGLAIEFDAAARQYLRGFRLGFPQSSRSSVEATIQNLSPPVGPHDYRGIVDRSLQFWVQPDSAAGNQSLVADTNQHGVRIENGNYVLRYAGNDYDSGVPVTADEWRHIMVASVDDAGVLYVDGEAVLAVDGAYDVTDTADLVIGSNTAGNENDFFFTGGTTDYFDGIIDDLELYVYGSNSQQDWGTFDFLGENAYARDVALQGIAAADVNLDGMVSGDGSGPAATDDVTAFVENFFTINLVDSIQVGDVTTRSIGDLDVNGIIDLRDWGIINAADPVMGSAILNELRSIPEPSFNFAALLAACACVRRRKG